MIKVADYLIYLLPSVDTPKIFVTNKDIKNNLETGNVFCLDAGHLV